MFSKYCVCFKLKSEKHPLQLATYKYYRKNHNMYFWLKVANTKKFHAKNQALSLFCISSSTQKAKCRENSILFDEKLHFLCFLFPSPPHLSSTSLSSPLSFLHLYYSGIDSEKGWSLIFWVVLVKL